jgi:hypothetical protein
MKLSEYLKANGEGAIAFAERAKISKATAFRIRNTGIAGSKTVINKIVAATKGAVTADELLGVVPKRKRKVA